MDKLKTAINRECFNSQSLISSTMNSLSTLHKAQLLIVFLLCSYFVSAQHQPQYTQYMYNTMSINPAYTGSLGTLDIVGTYRSQWVGVDGAPVTQNLGIHSPLNFNRVGVGFNLQNDALGPANQLFANANFSYSLQVSPTKQLAFGLKAGIKLFNVDFSRGTFQTPGDPLLSENIENRFTPTLGVGVYLYSDNWYVGFSVPDFATSDYFDDNNQAVAKEELQYYLIGGYVFDLSSQLKFKPAFLAKYTHGLPIVADFSANFLYLERFSLGASYRYQDAISLLAGFQVNDPFFVGYSYDYTTTGFSNYNSGSHEIIVRFTLPQKNKRINSPRYF